MNSLEKYKQYIATISIVTLGFIFARFTGVIKTIVIADNFGTSPEIAAYWVAFRIPDLLFNLLSGATLSAAFIPVFNKVMINKGEMKSWQYASATMNILTLATLILCVITIIFANFLVPLIAPGLKSDILEQAIFLTRIMLISPIFFCISGMSTGILNGRNHFLAPAIAPTIYNLSIIIGTITLSKSYGTTGLAISVVIGSIGHLLIQLITLKIMKMNWKFTFDLHSKDVRTVIKLALPRTIGLAANQINMIVLILFASTISLTAISAFTYSYMLVMLPVALIGMSISITIFPKLTTLFTLNKHREFIQTAQSAIFLIMFLSIPAVGGIILLINPITKIVFEHGEFTAESSAIVKEMAIYLSPLIIAFSLTEIFSRIYYALMDTKTPVIATIISVIINILICITLKDYFGFKSIALACSIASIVETLLLICLLKRKNIQFNYNQLINDFIKISMISLIMFIFTKFLLNQLYLNESLSHYLNNDYLRVILTIIISITSYFIMCKIILKEKTDKIIYFLKE